jgi:hypothetical protein
MKTCVIVIIVAILIVWYLYVRRAESFDNPMEKVTGVLDYFKGNKDPSFIEYKKVVDEDGSIVEYSDLKTLHHNGGLDQRSVLKVVTGK